MCIRDSVPPAAEAPPVHSWDCGRFLPHCAARQALSPDVYKRQLIAEGLAPAVAAYYTALAKEAGATVKRVHPNKLRLMTGTESHQGVDVYKRQAVFGPKGLAVRQLKRYASWVQNVVRQFGPYLSWAQDI